MLRRRRNPVQSAALLDRLVAVEAEIQALRLDAAELHAAHSELIELALIHAVPNAIHRLIDRARASGWQISYSRDPRGELHGSIRLEHPTDDAHNCSIQLPLPDDPVEHRKIESKIGMRIGTPAHRPQAA